MKYKITLALFSLLLVLKVQSQPWMNYVEPGKENNFYAIQKAFQIYASQVPSTRIEKKFGIEKKKVPGFKQFKRWEYFWQSRINEDGSFPNQEMIYQEWQKVQEQKNAKRSQADANWSLVGPYLQIPSSGGGMGRVNCISFKPGSPQTVWIGTPGGGVWTSNDGGTNWINTTTDNLPVLGISDIEFDYTNTNIIYLATGDGPSGDTYSLGVLKSIDGGITWQTTGLTYAFNQNRKLYKLAMHPTDPNILFAATSSGMYRSADGAATWTLVKTGVVRDVEFKPDDPTIVYCCSNTTVFKSTNSGVTFANGASGTGMPTTLTGRVEIAVSAASPNLVYALASNSSDDGFRGIYKSTDAALTWTTMATSPNLLGWDPSGGDAGGQAGYTLTLTVSPTNANELYVGGVNIWKSTNGGQSFSLNAHWYGGGGQPYVHADIHAMEYLPGTTSTLYVGCDGGVFKTSNSGNSYSDISDGLAIKQIYKFSNASNDETKIIMGAQDNGTVLKYGSSFDQVLGGDGMDCLIDFTDNNNVFGELYYGDLYKSYDGGFSFNSIAPATDGAWITPIDMCPTNHNIMYAGYTEIYKSTDIGDSWTPMTNNLTSGGTYVDVTPASDQSTVYAITGSKVYVSLDGANTFTLRNTGLPSNNYTSIETKIGNPLTAFLTIGAFSSTNKIYKTTNGGVSWQNFTKTGLPNVPINCSAMQPNSPERIFVGTDLGVYYTDTTITSWIPYNIGLPNTIVNDLEFHVQSNMLRAATYGRGVWETWMGNGVPTEIKSIKNPTECFIFPNPASESIKISFPNDFESTKNISIIDIFGKTVLETSTQNGLNKEINISTLSAGIYFVEIKCLGQKSVNKITVQK